MPQPVPLIPVKLDKERHLLFNFNAICDFEQVSGRDFTELKSGKIRCSDLRILIWAALKHEDPNLTLEGVGALIGPGNMAELAEQVKKAMVAGLPEEKKDDKSPKA